MKEETFQKYMLGQEMYLNGKSTIAIGKELHLDRSALVRFMKSNGIEVERMPHKKKINEDIFEVIDTEEKAYWLGFLYADGCVSSGNRNDIELSLKLSDVHHVEKFKNFIGFEGKLITDSYRCRVTFKNKKIKSNLIKLGCTPKKSLTLTFPDENQVPEYLIRHFIRGYFDGDGSIICTDKTKAISIIGTYNMLENICELVNIPKGRIYPLNNHTDKTFRIETGSKTNILNFIKFIYDDCNIYLDRKYKKYKMLIDYFTAV